MKASNYVYTYNPGTRLNRGPGDPGPGPGSFPLSRVGYPGPNYEAGVQLYLDRRKN